ncbi:MAG: von Willebrand factor type A domain-containing protein [Candidatus Delongbacteria bacterium]|nr:von Willebrand factor type A domain-containing protein [Candidatus Delongbacteria bacterium]
MKRFGFALILLMTVSSVLFGFNGRIKGLVFDEKHQPLDSVKVIVVGEKRFAFTNTKGEYHMLKIKPGIYTVRCELKGFQTRDIKNVKIRDGLTTRQNIKIIPDSIKWEDLEVEIFQEEKVEMDVTTSVRSVDMGMMEMQAITEVGNVLSHQAGIKKDARGESHIQHNTEEYSTITENQFKKVIETPISTFSIDVDAASYSNMRRFINQNQMPYKDAIRIEEMINYFNYDYEYPKDNVPFAVNTEISDCPWNKQNKLVHIGLQGKQMEQGSDIKSNFVFLLDVSGSMNSANKLGLLKKSFSLLLDALKPTDRVAIAVYAGAAGLILPSTEVSEKKKILDALNNLKAGGSTAGGAGIKLAYKIAEENLIKDGNNRIILATDGDFNVGVSSTSELVKMMEEKRNKGIFLTILGFGMGNYKDGRMEEIADKGNGNYFYIDNILEAKKVLVTELAGTMFVIAKDVKLQIEFNPAKVDSYRLIGYENRLLNKEDFNDDKKDAGELGAGHTVTALYEIVPANAKTEKKVDDLKYQQLETTPYAYKTNELMFVKLRYKEPKEDTSKLIEHPLQDEGVKFDKTSNNFRYSAAVAEFGMLLRESKFKGDSTFDSVLEMAKGSMGKDDFGYRAEFVQLVEKAKLLKK